MEWEWICVESEYAEARLDFVYHNVGHFEGEGIMSPQIGVNCARCDVVSLYAPFESLLKNGSDLARHVGKLSTTSNVQD
jgi:hypothetical protein